MISDILVFLINRLNEHFNILSGDASHATEEKVVFLDGDQKPDSITFKQNAVSVLLINIERDLTIRQPDNYVRVFEDGSSRKVNPDIILNLYVMFVPKYADYKHGLDRISLILSYFQVNPFFDQQNAPDLGRAINHLSIELNTLTTTQQNELWGMLRCSYLPSLVYKIKAATFIDDGELPVPAISEVNLEINLKG